MAETETPDRTAPVGYASQVVNQAPEACADLVDMAAPNGKGAFVALHQDYKLERLPGQLHGRRGHVFDDLSSFAAWLNRHAKPEQAEVLLEVDRCKAVLDQASEKPEIVSCELKRHPTFAAWSAAWSDGPLTQKAFHELVRGFRQSVGESDELLAALRVLTLTRKGELTVNIDETGTTRLYATTEKADLTAKLPPEFVVTCPVYQGILGTDGDSRLYRFEVLLSIDVDGAAPTFSIACPGLEVVTHEARRDAAAMLERELDDGFEVGLGALEHTTREVVVE